MNRELHKRLAKIEAASAARNHIGPLLTRAPTQFRLMVDGAETVVAAGSAECDEFFALGTIGGKPVADRSEWPDTVIW